MGIFGEIGSSLGRLGGDALGGLFGFKKGGKVGYHGRPSGVSHLSKGKRRKHMMDGGHVGSLRHEMMERCGLHHGGVRVPEPTNKFQKA